MDDRTADELICRQLQYFPSATSEVGIVIGIFASDVAGHYQFVGIRDWSAISRLDPHADLTYLQALIEECAERTNGLLNELAGAELGVRLSDSYRVRQRELLEHQRATIGQPTAER